MKDKDSNNDKTDINKSGFFCFSKDRKYIINLVICLLCFVGLLLVPSLIAIMLEKYVNTTIGGLIGDSVLILIIVLLYYKDLVSEAKIYFRSFKSNFKYSFKIYLLGFMGMVFFNLIIITFLKNISANETQVRELLYKNPVPTLINIAILAPILEELIFRKTLAPIIKNRWLYVIISGLLFGSAHILVNFIQGTFVVTDIAYIFPYMALGSSFALMDYNRKTTFCSIFIHALHNSFTAVLLLVTYFAGGK